MVTAEEAERLDRTLAELRELLKASEAVAHMSPAEFAPWKAQLDALCDGLPPAVAEALDRVKLLVDERADQVEAAARAEGVVEAVRDMGL